MIPLRNSPVSLIDLAWLAGIMEGEGTFAFTKSNSPRIRLGMTDSDVVLRAASLFGAMVHGPMAVVTPKGNVGSPMFYTALNGCWALGWMMTLYAFFGERRREKIRSIIAQWKDHPIGKHYAQGRARRGTRTPATCHPNKNVVGLGLCSVCYARTQYDKVRKAPRRLMGRVAQR